jgi:predicted secreted hydrolase
LEFAVTTPLQSQEIVTTNDRGPTYWEGAVDVEGEGLRGVGYLEMTGYAEQLRLGVERQAR